MIDILNLVLSWGSLFLSLLRIFVEIRKHFWGKTQTLVDIYFNFNYVFGERMFCRYVFFHPLSYRDWLGIFYCTLFLNIHFICVRMKNGRGLVKIAHKQVHKIAHAQVIVIERSKPAIQKRSGSCYSKL